jgi:glutaredoxin-like YruB-family protein
MDKTVTLFTQPGCAPCHAAKEYLTAKGVTFTERNIRQDAAAYKELIALGAQATPVAIVDGEVVMGFDRDKLEALLGA